LLLQLLGDLGFDFLQLGQLGFAHIVHADDVETKLALDGGVGHLAFVQLDHGARKFGHIAASCSPVQITTVGTGAWILGRFFGQVFKFGAFFDVRNQGFGFVFFFHQDVAGTVFLATVGGHELGVFSLDVGVCDRVLLLEIGKQLANQDGLTGQLELVFVVFGGVQTALFGFLHEDFAGDQLFLDLGQDFRRHRTAGTLHLLLEHFHAGGGHGLAVDHSKVLGESWRSHQCQNGGCGAEHLLFHGFFPQ
jgi:hypothetical protein